MAAASAQFLSLTPQTPSLHHSNSSLSASTLFTHSSFKALPKLVLALSTIKNRAQPSSKFVLNVSLSSEFGEAEKRGFSPDIKLFVGNLPFTVDSAALAGLFERAGNVEMVEVIYDKTSGRSRGFAFVTMSTAEESEAAAQQFNGYEFQGRVLRVNSGPPPSKRENSSFRGSMGRERENSSFRGSMGRERTRSDNSNRLYVGNLSWDVDNLALETLFGEHGNVKEARVVYDKENGRSRGFGFVSYSSPGEVNNAIEALDGADLDGRPIRVSPAADRRENY